MAYEQRDFLQPLLGLHAFFAASAICIYFRCKFCFCFALFLYSFVAFLILISSVCCLWSVGLALSVKISAYLLASSAPRQAQYK